MATRRQRLTQRDVTKTAKKYEDVDITSMNNPFEDPDPDKYDLATPDHFQELPDMRSEWQKDPGAYDEETNFMMPLDDTPSWWGQGPKMASMKAEACLKIAEAIFPDAVDEFVDAQAADFMEMPDNVVIATIRRLATYQEEPAKVASLLGKRAYEEDMDEPEIKEAAEGEETADLSQELDALMAENASTAPAGEEGEASTDTFSEGDTGTDEVGEASFEGLDEVGEASFEGLEVLDEEETTTASVNPSTEFGSFFEYDGNIEDVSFGNSVTASAEDLSSVFSDDYVDAGTLRKSASVKNSKASSNLKLSEVMGQAVPRKAASLNSLWDTSPNVSESFN